MKRKLVRFFPVIVVVAGMVLVACQSKELTSAKVYIQQDQWDKAIEQLEMAVENYPDDAEAHYLLGEGYASKGKYEAMNEQYEQSLELSDEFAQLIAASRDKYWVQNFNKGVRKINQDSTEAAIQAFKTAQLIDPSRPESYNNLAITYLRQDRIEDAIAAYQDLIEADPENVKAMNELGRLYIQSEAYEKAVELEQEVLEKEPDNADAVFNLGMAYDQMGQRQKARETYERALEVSPNNPDLLFNVARINFMSGDYETAIDLFKQVIEQNPDDFDANLNVGNAFLTMADEKRKELRDKENAGEEITEEELEQMQELYRQAIPYLEKAAEAQPEVSNIWYNLGVAYVNIGESEKGKEYFDKADELEK